MRLRALTSIVWLSCLLPPGMARDQAPAAPSPRASAEALLARVASYLAEYERRLPAVVGEEHYTQRASVEGRLGMDARVLRSDILVIADDEIGWISFRDVFEVDGGPVRNKDLRLADLFLKPLADRLTQARRIVAEGTRYNLNVPGYELRRSINMPLVALRFLRRPAQPRSRFRIAGNARIDGAPVTVLEFEERSMPRLINSPDDAAARGRFWIEPGAGRVLRSELAFETKVQGQKTDARSRVRVFYGRDPKVDEWLPLRMDEEHRVAAALIEGIAMYSNFRRFTVETRTDIKR